jgi:hypothetical protein
MNFIKTLLLRQAEAPPGRRTPGIALGPSIRIKLNLLPAWGFSEV